MLLLLLSSGAATQLTAVFVGVQHVFLLSYFLVCWYDVFQRFSGLALNPASCIYLPASLQSDPSVELC